VILISAAEIYDYVSTVTADYTTTTLTIKAQGVVTEEGQKNQVIHLADDNSEERITLSTGSIFYVSWDWAQLSESDAGTIMDLYHDSAKANGMGNSFKWTAHDGHTYVVRFAMPLTRSGNALSRWGFQGIRLRILGRIAD
jgi:hypothetical protein